MIMTVEQLVEWIIGRGSWSTLRKPTQALLCPSQIPQLGLGLNLGCCSAKLPTAWAMAGPTSYVTTCPSCFHVTFDIFWDSFFFFLLKSNFTTIHSCFQKNSFIGENIILCLSLPWAIISGSKIIRYMAHVFNTVLENRHWNKFYGAPDYVLVFKGIKRLKIISHKHWSLHCKITQLYTMLVPL
jgi:hypothetical protein